MTARSFSSHFGSGTSVVFHAIYPKNTDFALAAIEVVPLPAAGLLLGTALAGLAWMRRRSADAPAAAA